MKKRTLNILYYLAWIVGLIAAGFLIYGIISSLLLTPINLQKGENG